MSLDPTNTVLDDYPYPIAVAWGLASDTDGAESLDRLFEAQRVLLQTLCAFLLADVRRSKNAARGIRTLAEVPKLSDGHWTNLLSELVGVLKSETTPFMPEVVDWWTGKGRSAPRLINELTQMRNQRVHRGLPVSPADQEAFRQRVVGHMRKLLASLAWLPSYQLLRVRSAAPTPDEGFEGRIQYLMGQNADRPSEKERWRGWLTQDRVYLLGPDRTQALPLDPFVRVVASADGNRVHVLTVVRDGGREVCLTDPKSKQEITVSSSEWGDGRSIQQWLCTLPEGGPCVALDWLRVAPAEPGDGFQATPPLPPPTASDSPRWPWVVGAFGLAATATALGIVLSVVVGVGAASLDAKGSEASDAFRGVADARSSPTRVVQKQFKMSTLVLEADKEALVGVNGHYSLDLHHGGTENKIRLAKVGFTNRVLPATKVLTGNGTAGVLVHGPPKVLYVEAELRSQVSSRPAMRQLVLVVPERGAVDGYWTNGSGKDAASMQGILQTSSVSHPQVVKGARMSCTVRCLKKDPPPAPDLKRHAATCARRCRI